MFILVSNVPVAGWYGRIAHTITGYLEVKTILKANLYREGRDISPKEKEFIPICCFKMPGSGI